MIFIQTGDSAAPSTPVRVSGVEDGDGILGQAAAEELLRPYQGVLAAAETI